MSQQRIKKLIKKVLDWFLRIVSFFSNQILHSQMFPAKFARALFSALGSADTSDYKLVGFHITVYERVHRKYLERGDPCRKPWELIG